MAIVSQDTTFLGYQRENGRVGVRNHVIILPLDDLSNAAAEAVANNIKGALAIPHPVRAAAVRRRPRAALPHADRHRLQPERRRGRRDRHRGRLDQEGRRRHRRDRQARGRLRHRGPRRPRHDHARLEGGARVRAVGEREAARGVPDRRSCGSRPSAASRDTTSGCGANPDRRQRLRQALPARRYARASARPPSSPAASTSSPRAAATTRCARSSSSCSTATRR